MNLTVNGVEYDISSPPLTTLLRVLRDELDITSPKAGCEQGGCGTCTVLVDGEPRRSCLTALAAVDGAEITTVEGLGEPESLSPVQQAFHDHYAAQCGFCTPGFVLAAHALIERSGRRRPRRGEGGPRRPLLPLHGLCQDRRGSCRRVGRWLVKAVGARLPRYDGVGHVTGRTQFVDDVRIGKTLVVKALRSPHAHAAITRSTPRRRRR